MNKLVLITALAVATTSMSSCSSKLFGGKKKHKSDAKDTTVAVTTPVPPAPPVTPLKDTAATIAHVDSAAANRELISSLAPLWHKRTQYHTFTGKAKIHFEGPESEQDFNANVRMKKDTAIWINITGLGGLVQAARVMITPDSFIMINYLQKEVTRLPLTDIAKVLPTKIEFSTLQNLLVGDQLRDGNITRAALLNDLLAITVEDTSYIQNITYKKTDSTMNTGVLRTRAANGPQATIQYNDYGDYSGHKISATRAVRIDGEHAYALDLNFSSIDFDQPVEMPFSVPRSFKVKNPQ